MRTFVISPLALVVLVALVVAACEEPKGGFGKPDVKDPGVHVKEVAENPDAAPDFTTALTLAPRYDAAASELTVTLRLAEGFHAYGPGEEVGKPVSLAVSEANGWKVDGEVSIPAGKEKDLGELGKSYVLTGAVPLKTRVRGGSGALVGSVTVQVCTEKACDRPRPHRFEVPTS